MGAPAAAEARPRGGAGRSRPRPRAAAAAAAALPALVAGRSLEAELEGQRQLQTSRPVAHACDGYDLQWAQCRGLPECGECSPVDCEFGDWGEWEDGDGCIGLRFRDRSIKTPNNECGQPCEGSTTESRKHETSSCVPKDTDCGWSTWSEWTPCASEVDQATRSRSVERQATRSGSPCVGPVQQTRACGAGDRSPAPCSFSPWTAWSTCSATCGEGLHSRSRSIAVPARDGGAPCSDALLQTAACSARECPAQDCALSQWTQWSSCSGQEYPQRFRQRSVLVPPGGAGAACPPDLMQTEGCDGAQAQDCDYSEWTDWTKCDKTCDGGQTRRERKLLSPNTEGGECRNADLSQLMACNEVPCRTEEDNCRLSDWEDWSTCSARCGAGLHTRKRRVLANAKSGGRGCEGPLEELGECKEQDCTSSDCLWGEWFAWSTCSASCSGGIRHRSRVVEVSPESGPFCPPNDKKEVEPCNTHVDCRSGCIDGLWDSWGEWGECSRTCGTAFRTRSREVKTQPTSCGHNVTGPADDFEVCRDVPECEEADVGGDDCALADWGDWSRCSSSCHGSHERVRFISSFATRLGKPCLDTPIRVVEPCNPGVNETPPAGCEAKPVTDCVVNDWEPWTGCTATCGSGQRERRRTIKVPPANGGKPCVEDLSVTSDCNSQPCENASCVDCSWGAWSDWGDCSGCGGQRYRNRVVDQMPSYCGKPCTGSARDVANCTSPCAKQLFCVWTDWSDADTCGGCGLTTTSRTRSLDFSEGYVDSYLFQGPEDGKCEGDQKHLDECPFVDHCTPPCKPQDCTFSTWSEWHHNPDNCTGLCERHRVVAELNNECGKPCNGTLLETKKCDMTCEVSQDCLLSSWSHWTDCSASENGQYERAREVLQAPTGGGKQCDGALRETRACNQAAVKSEPYRLSSWEEWGGCSRSCGEGHQARTRKLLRPASGNATRFAGPLTEVQHCQLKVCEDAVDCKLSDWQEWMPCVLGQTTRNRSVTTQPAGGGRSCAATLRETATCARRPVDCEVADWTPWALCDRTCGGGQTNRQRQVLQFPANGGRPCPADLVEVRGCNSEACLHKNCEVGDWGAWGMCSTSCGAGQQMRSRAVLGLRDSQGYGCDDTLGETRDCRENPPCQRQDCEWGVWSEWGQCSVTCGGGQRSRNRSVVSPPSGGGSTCTANDREEVGPCNTKACTDVTSCIDGRWADWEHWAPCSVSCGGGQTFRKRKIMSSANFCGAEPTGSDSEMKFCNVWTECQKSSDCKMTSWGDWSACTAPCNGVKRRTRRVESYGTGKGQACEGALEMMEPCNPSPDEKMPAICSHGEPVDCELDQWTSWGDCSASCDGGQRVRHRDILQDPMFGGKACNSSTSQIEECGRSSCSGASPVDCEFGDWEPWGECTKCAGQRKRFRKIVTHGMHGGQSCGAFDSQEVGKCPRDCDENVFCVWKDWDEWSDCTATCGNSSKKQRRRYLHLSSSTKKDDEAPLPPAQDVMARYMDLQRRAKVLDRNHFLELFVAFAGGSISLVVVVAGIRIFNTARGSRAGWLPTGFWNGDALEQVGLTLIDPGVASRSRSMNEVELPLVGAGWN